MLQFDGSERGEYGFFIPGRHCGFERWMVWEEADYLVIVVCQPRRAAGFFIERKVTISQDCHAIRQLVLFCGEQANGPRADLMAHDHNGQRVDERLPFEICASPGAAELSHEKGVRDAFNQNEPLRE
ncbi:hypothetical protein BA062_36115 [Prauserella flavalba]|uniref:Uncharacterized protein n=1 Tax=Prauserella flavalba TaxID=1477506 RepID=A0A318LGR9_9PSEU|nr:hypothetical protein BA062_36115 [Prauserella flavalba]